MESDPVEPDSDLDKAIDELFSAWHKYRDFIKRHHRARLAGVMVVTKDTECLVYTSNERYRREIFGLIWDRDKDSFVAVERSDEEK